VLAAQRAGITARNRRDLDALPPMCARGCASSCSTVDDALQAALEPSAA